jgi:hypothetical protein
MKVEVGCHRLPGSINFNIKVTFMVNGDKLHRSMGFQVHETIVVAILQTEVGDIHLL